MKAIEKFDSVIDEILEGMTSANVMPPKVIEPKSNRDESDDDEDDLKFPVEVLTTLSDGHYHVAIIKEDGTGLTTETYDKLDELMENHVHKVTDYVKFGKTNGHTHKLDA